MDDKKAAILSEIPRLRRYARSLLRDRDSADDLVQDCLERAISRWHLRRRDWDLRAWLFAILRNLFLSAMRQRARRGPHVGPEALEAIAAPEGSPEAALGARFDIRQFHERVLEQGIVPLQELRDHVRAWVAAQK